MAGSSDARIPFQVVHCSSYDDRGPSPAVLEQVHPQSPGWISDRFCQYPQELTLELDRPVRIKQIQILSHQWLIAQRIELYIGRQPGVYTRLGYLSLDPNRRSAFKARELKTVDLQVQHDAKFVQLVVHRNHDNDMNTYGQVGLIAINVLGERVDRYNPADLSVDVECDPQTARLIRLLHDRKRKAVEDEDFDQAKQLKEMIQSLRKVGVMLAQLEAEKLAAVAAEDYDRAKAIKARMDVIRDQHGHGRAPLLSAAPGNEVRAPSPVRNAPLQGAPGRTAVPKSPENGATDLMYDDRPLPALNKKQLHEPSDPVNPFGDRGPNGAPVAETASMDSSDPAMSDPAPLSEPEKLQHAALIRAFGEPVVTLLLSRKAFQHRINALDEIDGIVSGSVSGKDVHVDLVANALGAVAIALPDPICQVSVRSMCLIETLINRLFPNMLLDDVQECIDPVMPSLLALLDGSLGRQRDKARHIFDLLIMYPSVVGRFVTKPLKNTDAYKPLKGRVELLTVFLGQHGLSEENGVRLDLVVSNFALPALRHKRDSIRQAGPIRAFVGWGRVRPEYWPQGSS